MSKEVDNLRAQRELFELRSTLKDFMSVDWQVRVRALGELTQQKKSLEFYEEAVPVLIKACSDENYLVRQAAIPFLGDLGGGGNKVIDCLFSCLKRDDLAEVKAAIYSLGKIGPEARSVVNTLIPLLAKEEQDLSKAISWSLSMMGPEAVPELISGANAEEKFVKIGCITALGNMGPIAASALPSILKALENEDNDVRNESAKAIGNLRALPEISQAIPNLKVRLTDKDPDVRWAAAEALRKIGTEEAMEAWASYQEIGSADSYLKQLTNSDKAVRLHAAESLYAVFENQVELDFEILKKALNDSYLKVPVALCLAISRLEEKALPLEKNLQEMLKHEDWSVKVAAAQCLGKINATSGETTTALANLLKDAEKEVRMAAGLALELLDTKEAQIALKGFKWE